MIAQVRKYAAWPFERMAAVISGQSLRNPSTELLDMLTGGSSDSGISVTADTAMRLAAVSGCIRILTESLAQIPCIVYKTLSDDSRERAKSFYLYNLLHRRPNPLMTASRFQRVMAYSLVSRGNAYARKTRNPISGAITALWPIHPDRVEVKQDETTGDIFYRVTTRQWKQVDLPRDEMFHLRGISQDGLVGLNPIQTLMREAIGNGLAQQLYNAKLFSNGVNPSAIIHPKTKLTKDGAEALKAHLKKQWTGNENMRGLMLLFDDIGLERLSFNPEESQFLELCKFSKEEIASIFRVPLHLLNALDRATFNNIEELGLGFLKYTLQPYFDDWAQEISYSLLSEREQEIYVPEFLTAAFERGSVVTRYQAYQTGINSGFLNPNEVRRMENLPPYEGGNEFVLMPGATTKNQPENDSGADNAKVIPMKKRK